MTTTTLPVTDDELRTIVGDQPQPPCESLESSGEPATWVLRYRAHCDSTPRDGSVLVCGPHKDAFVKDGICCNTCKTPMDITRTEPLT